MSERQRAWARSGNAKRTHGQTNSKEYRIWCNMHDRCRNPRNKRYARYGGRGVSVCGHWGKFENFLADMGRRPPSKTLDRIDNDGDYEPGNCRWATLSEQARNRRTNRYLTVDGDRMTAAGAAERFNIDYGLLILRLRRGWPAKRAVSEAKMTASDAGTKGSALRWGNPHGP